MSQIYISYSTDPIAVLDFSMNNTNYIFISFGSAYNTCEKAVL